MSRYYCVASASFVEMLASKGMRSGFDIDNCHYRTSAMLILEKYKIKGAHVLSLGCFSSGFVLKEVEVKLESNTRYSEHEFYSELSACAC